MRIRGTMAHGRMGMCISKTILLNIQDFSFSFFLLFLFPFLHLSFSFYHGLPNLLEVLLCKLINELDRKERKIRFSLWISKSKTELKF